MNETMHFRGPNNVDEVTWSWAPITALTWKLNVYNTPPRLMCMQFEFLTCGDIEQDEIGSGLF